MKVLFISDLHYALDQTLHGCHPRKALGRVIAHANRHHSDAALCVVLGDLTDNGLAAEYQSLKAALKALRIPYRLLLGNHDDREAFELVFGRAHLDVRGFVQASVAVGDQYFLLLDTHTPGVDWGCLDDERIEWLDRALTIAERPCSVCLHHPPLPTHLPAYDAIGLHGADRLASVLAQHGPKVAHVFFGHCHMSISGHMGHIPVSGIRSLTCQARPNLESATFINAPDTSPAYAVAVFAGTSMAVHTIELGCHDRPEVYPACDPVTERQ